MHRIKLSCFVTVLLLMGCGDGKKYHATTEESKEVAVKGIADILLFQDELNEEYRDPETSPLADRHRAAFEGLDFFAPDTTYRVIARFERTPNALPFLMPTTTDRKSEETVYGIAHFMLQGQKHQLEVYQSKDLMEQEKYKNYLFLPFLDETNGEETYAGGRYIELSIPEGDSIVIDFNKAYNPYCAYNTKYSCPIVPWVNTLDLKVKAGVKEFKK